MPLPPPELPTTRPANPADVVIPVPIAEKIWKEKVEAIRFYHGTSETIAQQVQKVGLSPNQKPYLSTDHAFFLDILNKLGSDTGYTNNKENTFYITSSLEDAAAYAIMGPEMLRIFYLRKCDAITDDWESGKAQTAGVTSQEMDKVRKIHNKIKTVLNQGRPAMVEILKNSPTLQTILKKKINNESFYQLLIDKKAFAAHVKDIVARNQGMTEEKAAEELAQIIRHQFHEVRVTETIPPTELMIKKGTDFDNLTRATKERAKVITYCFSDIAEQPFEVINAVQDFINYNDGNRQEFIGLCKYYNIGENKAHQIFDRAKKIKEAK